ncbi:MAG: methyltransferase domain-containing protein [Betaproteobacteria bacterium]|nr:methyltransferase domain-containing protein [Betaproteobacteria bacterium]
MTMNPFERLRGEMSGFRQVSILAALAELDFGTVILENGNNLSAIELATLCSCDERGTVVLLDALSALSYLLKSETDGEARYSVAEEYKPYLDSRHPSTFIPMMRHMACGQRTWARLTWSVKDGKPQKHEPSILGEEQDRISFIMGMHSIAANLVDSVIRSLREARILPFDKQNPRILDIGGASGTYTEAFLKELPGSSATIFDLPVGIAQAKNRFAGSDMGARVSLVEGDFTETPLPSDFDFAWISAIIHQMNRDESRMLYAKALDALNPGGLLAVRDFVMSEDRLSPIEGALFGINMFVNTQNGMVYTYKEIKEDLELAGFAHVTHAVDVPSMAAVVIAKKPDQRLDV